MTQKKYKGAPEVADVLFALQQGIWSYEVMRKTAAEAAASGTDSAKVNEQVTLASKSGYQRPYSAETFRNLGTNHPLLAPIFERAMIVGALIEAAETLKTPHEYFDHAPDLELIYHLRNGIAHGNRFNIEGNGITRLGKYPAFRRIPYHPGRYHEIDLGLNGKSIFDFVGAGDVSEILLAAWFHVIILEENNRRPVDTVKFESPDLQDGESMVFMTYGKLCVLVPGYPDLPKDSSAVHYIQIDPAGNFSPLNAGATSPASMLPTGFVVRRKGTGYETIRRLARK
jgi:hypothetical protein